MVKRQGQSELSKEAVFKELGSCPNEENRRKVLYAKLKNSTKLDERRARGTTYKIHKN